MDVVDRNGAPKAGLLIARAVSSKKIKKTKTKKCTKFKNITVSAGMRWRARTLNTLNYYSQ